MRKHYLLTIACIIQLTCTYAQTAHIDINTSHQEIKGFGGINHPTWYSDLNSAERELAFGNGPNQLGLTVLRTYVSENTNEWSLGLQTAQRAYELGATIFASPWHPPAEMTITVDGQKRINPNSFEAYANHLNDYVTYMNNNNVDLYAISIQNEPDYAHDWTEWSAQECVDFIKGYGNIISCKLMTPESFQYRKTLYDPILNDPQALANVDIFGTHLYGTPYSNFPYPLFEQNGTGKELWMTEVYTDSQYDANLWNDGIINQDHHALKVAEHIHYAMVDGNFQTYVFWPIRRYYALIHDGNSDSQGNPAASAGTATKRGYCMAQFSKWVRPGYVRIGATKSPASNVFVSAYKKDNDVVIVVVNKNTSSQSLTLNIPGTQVSSWEQYTTSASKNIAQGNTIQATDNFSITLDAASVTTFVGVAQAGIPNVEITAPQENDIFIAPASIPVSATATDSDGTIEHVDFYVNDETSPFQEEWTAPYEFNWEVSQAGTYQLKAIVYDNEGNTSEDIVTITVNIPQGPYGGTAAVIPGTIECEHFDVGGNNFAYYDTNPGTEVDPAPDFRTDEDVDIETCTDEGGGYNIGYAMAGEWLEYTVNVQTTGMYDITFRVACDGDNRTVSLESDNTMLAENVAIPNTGGWQTWTDVTVEDVELQAGEQVLRLTIGENDYVNLNNISFSTLSTPTTIQLRQGWNLIGYPLSETKNLETGLESIWSEVDAIKDFEGFYIKSNQPELNSLTELSWGKGYYIYVTADCELVWNQ